MKKAAKTIAVLLLAASVGACAGMTRSERNTAVGAGAGAAVGAVLTGGSVLGTAAGAAVGGVIGHEANRR